MSRKTKQNTRKAPLSLAQARKQTQRRPEDSAAWVQLGRMLSQRGELDEARQAFEEAVALAPDSHDALEGLGQVELRQHRPMQALKALEQARELAPNSITGLVTTAKVYLELAGARKAVEFAQQAVRLEPNNLQVLDVLGSGLGAEYRYDEAIETFDRLIELDPKNFVHWNNAGNMRRELGMLKEAYHCYRKATELNPGSAIAYSNHLTAMHYDPTASREEIAELARSWEERYAPTTVPARPLPADCLPNKRLRIGMLSDGLRKHPVGKMIVRCLECLDPAEVDIYAYTSSEVADDLTRRVQTVANRWQSIRYLSDDDLASQLRDDEVDILIDLSGHNAGTRMRLMAMQPAPLLVKWVGGLINTTGVKAIDYLISDHIETPAGEDAYFTEKLIRMPDDYIVFDPPSKLPEVGELPAKRNDYITLACFNNPTKLNSVTLAEWAKIMHQLPNSKLLLKGRPYTSEEFCERLYSTLEAEGIERGRLLIEGPGTNYEVLEAYSKADIALDPWPYSGGLTTCEAFLMGVPVVTLPGPTFAGRHSASHLVHAGMPELVTHSWDEYHERVLELASDLNSLGTIRQHLRDVLLQSPVCDGPRFAKHFTHAMRAIWQRYCEEKPPAALAFTQDGQPQFDGESVPVALQLPPTLLTEKSEFNWTFTGKVVAIDNGSRFLKQAAVQQMLKLKTLEVIAFDPAGELNNDPAGKSEGVHYYAGALLGSGGPETLYACMDPAQSATLPPLDNEWLPATLRNANKVLAKLPVNSLALDSIDGIPALDWLLLDAKHNAITVLENGSNALKSTLLLDVSVAFQPTHEHQPNLAELQHWASRNGFRFYRLNTPRHQSHLPESLSAEKRQATELQSADALFLPSHERMAQLTDNQRTKLAFLLHTVYGIKDMAYRLLAEVEEEEGEGYLVGEGLANKKLEPVMKREVIYDSSQLECNQREFTLCVGVPVYNEEKYIRETLQSLKKQDFEDVKFLIADNCSVDGTLDIIREETAGDDRFEIFQHSENIGASRNFEFIFNNSKSKYFMWLGAHDFLSDSYLSLVVENIEKHPEASMVMGNPMAVDEESCIKGIVKSAIYDFSDSKKENRYLRSVAELANCTVFHSVFFRKYLDNFIFKATISHDHVLISHLLWYGKLLNVEDVCYFRRYFSKRAESQEERISGNKGGLKREDFYEYYLADLEMMSNEVDVASSKELAEKTNKIIKSRFG